MLLHSNAKKIAAEHMRVISVIQRAMNQAGSDQEKTSKKQRHHVPCDVKVRLQLQPYLGGFIVCP